MAWSTPQKPQKRSKVFLLTQIGMPPNTKGGKGYKKKKKVSSQASKEIVQIKREPDQMPARALKLLGNRQVLCYCNDDVVRNCHICGRMKGKQYVNIGDVVLVSLRDWSPNVRQKDIKYGDIINMYTRDHYSELRKDPAVNNRILLQLEMSTGFTMASLGEDCSGTTLGLPEDDGDYFESSDEEAEEAEGAPATTEADISLDDL
jgi:initiation factor 1A